MIDIIIFILLIAIIVLMGYGLFGINIANDASEKYSQRLNSISGIKGSANLLSRYFLEIMKKQPGNSGHANRKRNVEKAIKKFSNNKKKQTLAEKINSSGLQITPKRFIAISFGVGAIMLIVLLYYTKSLIISICIGLVATFLLPDLFLKFKIKSYQKAFLNNFIGALEIIVRGVQSGLPLSDCMAMISREGEYPIRQEFYTLIEEQKIGLTLPQALKRMNERLPLPEIGFFCIVLNINSNSGGNISEPLNGLIDVLRGRKQLAMKVKSATAESKGSAMVLASVPFIVGASMYFLNPTYFSVMVETGMGLGILAGTLVWMGIGGFVMRSMINFKY